MSRKFFTHLKKLYPECSRKDLEDLIGAIKGDKYWLVDPNHEDAIYIVALTRANILKANGLQAKATHLKRVIVVAEAARFSRRGRVLMAVKSGSNYIAKSVITWPAFLRMMGGDSITIYKMLMSGSIPPFVNSRNVSTIVHVAREKTIS